MKRLNFHVFVIPLSFIIYLYAQNANLVNFQNIFLSMIVLIVLSTLLYLFFYVISRSWEKAAIVTSIFFILLLNFKSITMLSKALLEFIHPNVESPANFPQYSVFILGIVFVIILFIILRTKKEPRTLNRLAGIFSIGMIGIVFGILVYPTIGRLTNADQQTGKSFSDTWQANLAAEPDMVTSSEQLPDIYYLVLDGYGRSDVLEELYSYDNQPFLNALSGLGFKVSSNSLSNYKATTLSIASSLNLDYIDWIYAQTGNEADYRPLFNIIEHNRLSEQLQRLGYRINTFATGFSSTEIETADHVFRPALYPNEFEMLLINATPLGLLWNHQLHDIHRDRVVFTLENLASAGNQPGPDFVFAHILSPHPPFVFDADGNSITPNRPYTFFDASDYMEFASLEEYKTGYINQMAYLNQLVLAAVRDTLQSSSTPPIIIIQGDHGPGSQLNHQVLEESNLFERYPILNAIYIPCGTGDDLPEGITPVNTFRFVFNSCFNAGLHYLENRQYFSPNVAPFRLTDVTEQLTQTK